MSLFTSNFKSELKVLATVATVLLGSEAAVRFLLVRVSSDWSNFAAIQQMAQRSDKTNGQKVLLLGNSLIGQGIDVSTLRTTLLSAGGAPLSVDKAATDDSNVTEWFYLVAEKFTNPSNRPDLLVIGYAEDQLSDRAPVHVDRLAGYYGGLRIAPQVFRDDVRDFGSRTDYVLGSVSALYANRDRVRTQLMDRLIPSYRSYAQQTNHTEKTAPARRAVPTYERLRRLLTLCREHSIQVVVVAMPIPYAYQVDNAALSLAREYDATFLDMTKVPFLTTSHYPDGYHLDRAGQQIYSQHVGLSLARSEKVLPLLRGKKPQSVAGL